MTSGQLVDVRRTGRVAYVTLNRPDKLNAFHTLLVRAVHDALESLRGDGEALVVVLSGAGSSFSAGADVQELHSLDEHSARLFISSLHELFQAVQQLPQIVIAAIDGHCYGGALELVAACDLRIATDRARFGMPEIVVGMPSVIEAALLVPLVGLGRASQLVLTGEVIDAHEAERIGLIGRVIPAAEFTAETDALAFRLAAFSGPALRLQKQLIKSWQGTALDGAVNDSIAAFAASFASPNPREALAAFLEKRPPHFTEP